MIRSRRNLFKRALATTGVVIASSSVVSAAIKEPLPEDIQRTILQHYIVDNGNINQQTFDSFDVTTTTAKQMWDHQQWKDEMARIENERRLAINPHHHTIYTSHRHDSGTVMINTGSQWVSIQDAIEANPPEVIVYEAKAYTQYDTSHVDQFLTDYKALTA